MISSTLVVKAKTAGRKRKVSVFSDNKKGSVSQGEENTRLAAQLYNKKNALTRRLSRLPVTALWMLTKYGQKSADSDDDNQEQTVERQMDALRVCYQNAYDIAQVQGLDSETFEQAHQRLQALLNRDIRFIGEDFHGLCRLISQQALKQHKTSALFFGFVDEMRHCRETDATNNLLQSQCQQIPDFLFPADMFSETYLSDLSENYRQWKNARQQFAEHNNGLVRLLRHQYKGELLGDDDLFQEGLIGLLRAIDRFDYRLGFKFSTYAAYWIRQAMSRALTRGERTVRLPFAQMTSINKLRQARESFLAQTGCEPNELQLAETLGLSTAEIIDLQAISQVTVSLDESFGDEKNENNLLNVLQQECHDSPLKQQSDQQLHQLFVQALSVLNSKERLIICWRFGFNCTNELTLEEIGKQLDLTRERVRQIQVLAMEKIKCHYGAQLQHFLA